MSELLREFVFIVRLFTARISEEFVRSSVVILIFKAEISEELFRDLLVRDKSLVDEISPELSNSPTNVIA